MSTAFSYEHVFRATSTATILNAYFDPDHLATQDKVAELGERTVVESRDEPTVRSCTWRVTSQKPLPLFVRAFVKGGRLQYLESMTWRRADDAIDLTVRPDILGGRVQISAVYELVKIGEGQIRRRYSGTVAANVSLLSSKIERGIAAEFEKSMPLMTACTQGWLDRTRG